MGNADTSPEILRFRTNDPDCLSERMSPLIPGISARSCSGGPFEFSFRVFRLPHAIVFMGRPDHAEVMHGPEGEVGITMTLDGEYQLVDGGAVVRYPAGTAYLSPGDRDFHLRAEESATALVFKVDASHFHQYSSQLSPAETAVPVRHGFLSLRSPEGLALWRSLSRVWRDLTEDGALLRSPIAARETEDTLAALLRFASAEGANPASEGCDGAHLRRAEDYMMAHLAEAVSLVDLTEAAGVSASTLLRAFAKRYQITPMAFLRQRRLEAVHRVLLAADPCEGLVTETALRFGFGHLGRFAADYREAFDERPSETLRAKTGFDVAS